MQKEIRCECGFVAVASEDDDLVDEAQRHARAAHGTEITADVVLALTRPRQRPVTKSRPDRTTSS